MTKIGRRVVVQNEKGAQRAPFHLVRPAGRVHLEVKVLYTLGKEKC
jgi:hypothetical protein